MHKADETVRGVVPAAILPGRSPPSSPGRGRVRYVEEGFWSFLAANSTEGEEGEGVSRDGEIVIVWPDGFTEFLSERISQFTGNPKI